ncbi:MAG TPA: DUF3467 domain-containing protein [Candidatus Saccharimonadales bacterium]
MANNDDQQQPVNFGVDPNKVPLLFVESYLIGSNENSVTFNFAQPVLDGQQQNIVARVAMTREQAKQFLKNLNDHIEKFEL